MESKPQLVDPEHSPSPNYDPDIQAQLAVWGYWVMYSGIPNGDAEPEDRYIEQFATQEVAADASELLFIEQDGTRYGAATPCEAYVATVEQQPDGNYLVAELELIGASNGCPE